MKLMLDLETMGTSSIAAIVQIGACDVDDPVASSFKINVDLQDCIDEGLRVDGGTVHWWLGQSDAARASIRAAAEPLGKALELFSAWILPRGPIQQIWSLPSTFDLVILGNAYDTVGLKRPWGHRAENCLRTAGKLFPESAPAEGAARA